METKGFMLYSDFVKYTIISLILKNLDEIFMRIFFYICISAVGKQTNTPCDSPPPRPQFFYSETLRSLLARNAHV